MVSGSKQIYCAVQFLFLFSLAALHDYCTEESVLRDLKALLLEANQKVPPFLYQLDALSDDIITLGGQLLQ